MDLNDFRAWFTVVMIITFAAIVIWAWSRKRVKDFRDAANLPFDEPESPRQAKFQRHTEHRGDAQ